MFVSSPDRLRVLSRSARCVIVVSFVPRAERKISLPVRRSRVSVARSKDKLRSPHTLFPTGTRRVLLPLPVTRRMRSSHRDFPDAHSPVRKCAGRSRKAIRSWRDPADRAVLLCRCSRSTAPPAIRSVFPADNVRSAAAQRFRRITLGLISCRRESEKKSSAPRQSI